MYYNEDDFLQLSGIQHFSFCRRQWALIHIENQWDENYLTAHGRILHDRVHDNDCSDIRNGILTIRGLSISSSALGTSGSCDAVEFIPCKNGITLNNRSGQWRIRPVEYKRGKPKTDDCDKLQLCAQAICLEEMFCCDIEEAHLFYFETKHREKIEITDELKNKTKMMFEEMHELYSKERTPIVKKGKRCGACSMSDICLPVLSKKEKRNVKDYIERFIGDIV